MLDDLPKNPITGKCDGLLYTFGNTEPDIVLAKILLSLDDPKQKKFYKVTSRLAHYTDGLKTLALLPKDSAHRNEIALLWREKFIEDFKKLLTVEEGQSYLLNVMKMRYREILLRS
jgi:hypothetical protein